MNSEGGDRDIDSEKERLEGKDAVSVRVEMGEVLFYRLGESSTSDLHCAQGVGARECSPVNDRKESFYRGGVTWDNGFGRSKEERRGRIIIRNPTETHSAGGKRRARIEEGSDEDKTKSTITR